MNGRRCALDKTLNFYDRISAFYIIICLLSYDMSFGKHDVSQQVVVFGMGMHDG